MATVDENLDRYLLLEDAAFSAELEYMAFHGQYEKVYAIFRRISAEQRDNCISKYILHAVVYGGVQELRAIRARTTEEEQEKEKEEIVALVEYGLRSFISNCRSTGALCRELFEAILLWSEELVAMHSFQEALRYYDAALNLEIIRYPNLYSRALIGRARIFGILGRLSEAESSFSFLVEKPYLASGRNVVAEVIFELGKAVLMKGDVEYYKSLLWSGLGRFYTDVDTRLAFIAQIIKTYRGSLRILLSREVKVIDKLLFLLHWPCYATRDIRFLTATGVNRLLRLGLLVCMYLLNYGRAETPISDKTYLRSGHAGACNSAVSYGARHSDSENPLSVERRNVLVTRVFGGIGDLLMMTPGLHALKQKCPGEEIHLAIPRRFFPVFQENEDVTLLDIENDAIDIRSYRTWFNFTDCPASRVEARTAPKVRKSRIDVFASALGISRVQLWQMDGRPRYFVSRHEKEFRQAFWKEHDLEGQAVVGIGLCAAETYRNYPHMMDLVRTLSTDMAVLLFHSEAIQGYDWHGVIRVDTYPLRQAVALAAECDVIVTPDSSLVHFAAALDVPCIALFGPLDGKVRTKHYPRCEHLDAKSRLRCVPCWRNEDIPCKLSGTRESACMRAISVDDVCDMLARITENYGASKQ